MKAKTQIIFATLVTITMSALAFTLCFSEKAFAAPPPKPDPKVPQTNSVPQKVISPDTAKPVAKRKITGAELYSINCNRCHPERYPTERTAAQWKTIMLHMQVRANIPASQARLILKYLQENSGR